MKILMVFGTRPEAIKMAPLIHKLKQDSYFELTICVTGQHREQLDQVLEIFDIKPDIDFNIMKHGQTLSEINAKILLHMQDVLMDKKYDLVLVHGDPTSTLAGALGAFYMGIPVGHVEAGLRSGNIYSPFPEELNRVVVDKISSILFAATIQNKAQLISEGIDESQIFITGNTVIDALFDVSSREYDFSDKELLSLDPNKKIILLTAHRRENLGENMVSFLSAIKQVIAERSDLQLVWPVHLNPKVRDIAERIFANQERVHLVNPLEYLDMVKLMKQSHIILTDSGGIQEEAPALGVPVILLRTETERQEAIDAGTVIMAGVEYQKVYDTFVSLLTDSSLYEKVASSINPYGDGRASERIAEAIKKWHCTRLGEK